MGHVLFFAFHFAAILFAPIWLLATLPMHLLYSAALRGEAMEREPNPNTHVRCPDCQELVLAEARKCKHCGCGLVPVSEQKRLRRVA